MKASIEVVRRVYDDGEGVAIEVGRNADNQEWIDIGTAYDKKAEEYYGPIRLSIPKEQARLLAKAIIDCADEVLTTCDTPL